MKNYKNILKLILFLVVIFTSIGNEIRRSNIYNPVYGYDAGYSSTTVVETTSAISKVDLVKQIVKLPQEYNANEVNKIINRLSLYDYKLLLGLIDCNGKIVLTNGKLTDLPELQYLRGTLPKGRTGGNTWDYVPGLSTWDISYVRIGYSYPGYDTNHGSLILELHEVSHLVDYCALNHASGSDVFKEIHRVEKELIFPNFDYYDYIEEYFAETLSMYVYSEVSRYELRSKAPLTYDYYNNLIDEL